MEVCRMQYQGNTFAFQRDEDGEGNWLCVQRGKDDKSLFNINQIIHRSFQLELSKVAAEEKKVDSGLLVRYLANEKEKKERKQRQPSESPIKSMGKVIKIFG